MLCKISLVYARTLSFEVSFNNTFIILQLTLMELKDLHIQLKDKLLAVTNEKVELIEQADEDFPERMKVLKQRRYH